MLHARLPLHRHVPMHVVQRRAQGPMHCKCGYPQGVCLHGGRVAVSWQRRARHRRDQVLTARGTVPGVEPEMPRALRDMKHHLQQ
jgi:hypothetical protein